ncbi:MAG: HPF/RaiA family ribosome-associated protein [Deltaproteobacteria bacterium]|nr:HPF/RaiA family ribosome-associated protein [Deltaproteobacteria bacterium]
MRIEVRGKGVEITSGLRTFVERRARLALGSRSEKIDRLQVWIEDVNGPKGGTDKVCRVKVTGREVGEHLLESASAEIGASVFDAVDRAARLASRSLERARAHARGQIGDSRPWALRFHG